MEPSREIRKLPTSHRSGLINILESGEAWKKLMGIIPKTLEKENFKCDFTPVDNPRKYNVDHFRLIESASLQYNRPCTDILLDEWGTSGRIRPALGHLLYLLIRAELYRAADYVSIDILKKEPVKRPSKGPAAVITVDLNKIHPKKDPELEKFEKMLDEIDYPSSAIENIINSSVNTNLNYSSKKINKIPEIVISESPEEINENQGSVFNMPVVYQSGRRHDLDNNEEVSSSDMIKFSTEQNIPEISLLNNSQTSEQSNEFNNANTVLPNLTEFNLNSDSENSIVESECSNSQSSVSKSNSSSSESSRNIPNLSIFESNNTPSASNLPAFSQLISGGVDNNIPNISSLLNDSKNDTVNSSTNNDNNIPNFSAFLESNNNNSKSSSSKKNSGSSTDSMSISDFHTQENNNLLNPNQKSPRPSCTSPLPNLSLNTLLPHFTYYELEVATNNFNEIPVSEGGRFLGSGAFGTVYLAAGLLNMSTAIKKIMLDDVEVVNIDDAVTKQFRTEVEILSKYKHENLLNLLGYSCDGPTYCLMYEYIPGGALKDRLQNQENKLIWTERLYIAIGTSKAICYLHTAVPTPLIHRDIKTANILLDVTNKPKLCDFGLIKLLPNQNTSTSTTVYGTSAYMAPEAFRGDISVKMDTFSFGVVLLELLTSLPPLDENREGCDLITHVGEICDESIEPLLDTGAGPWVANDVNFGEELYTIAKNCLREKKKRPKMVDVTTQLGEIVQKSL